MVKFDEFYHRIYFLKNFFKNSKIYQPFLFLDCLYRCKGVEKLLKKKKAVDVLFDRCVLLGYFSAASETNAVLVSASKHEGGSDCG